MLFLIDYDRREGKIVTMRTFDDAQRQIAYKERFELERTRDLEASGHEVVLLEAADEQVIRKTHGRYFETLEELARPPKFREPNKVVHG